MPPRIPPEEKAAMVPLNPSGLCMCGCGEPAPIAKVTHRRLGYIKGLPVKYVLGHSPRSSPVEYVVDEVTGCWVWQRALNNGYGSVQGGLAHRVYYERSKGPIPEGLQLDHLCRNTRCVNPDHLEAVTPHENVHRSARPIFSANDVALIRSSDASTAELARRFGCSWPAVDDVRQGRSYKHLPFTVELPERTAA